jgi:hypothetical protein
MMEWRETWYSYKHMFWNQAKCELKKDSLSPTLLRTHNLVVFIYEKVTLWFGPQGVPSFVRRRSTHPTLNITRARRRRRPAGSDRAGLGLGLGDVLIF